MILGILPSHTVRVDNGDTGYSVARYRTISVIMCLSRPDTRWRATSTVKRRGNTQKNQHQDEKSKGKSKAYEPQTDGYVTLKTILVDSNQILSACRK